MLYAIVGVLVLLVDQFLKFWTVSRIELNTGIRDLIPGVIHLSHIKNFGALFGVFKDAGWVRWVALVLMLLFAAAMIMALLKGWLRTGLARWSGVLLLAGVLGNGIDRAIYGYVVDMFEFEFMNFALFNIADALILVCGILFCISAILGGIGMPEAAYEEDERVSRRARDEEEEEEEELPVRSVRRRTEEVPVRRSAESAAAPRARRVIDESTVPVPERKSAPVRPVQRVARPVDEDETLVRPARTVQRTVRPADDETLVRPARTVQRTVRPADDETLVRPTAQRTARPTQEAPAVPTVQRVVRHEPEETAPVVRTARALPKTEETPVKAAAPAKTAPVKPAPAKPASSADEFDLDSILAEFK